MSIFGALTQNVTADAGNSSTANLEAAATFEGTGKSTLGVVGLQWSLKTSENCTVYIEESPDNSNWDISYEFDYIASKGGRGETIQASQAYWRIRVTNEGLSTTSYFRLQAVLCPVATPLPSALSDDGRLLSESHLTGNDNRHVWVNPTSELATSPVYRLVGTTFIGNTVDPNFWSAVVSDGTVTQGDGIVELNTTATINGKATLTSVRKGRFVAGSAMLMSGAVNWVTAGTASNVRRVGAYTATDGFFFQLSGTTFSVGTRIGSSDTLVDSGDFNGDMGDTFTPTADTYYKIAIEWTPLGVIFYINDTLLHKISGASLSATPTLPIEIDNDNGAITTDISFKALGLYIARQGELETNPAYKHVPSAGTYICKYGAGVLHGIAINNPSAGCTCTVYDNTAGSGTTIAILELTTKVITPFFMNYKLPFGTGLTIVTDAASDFTIIYE